MSSGVGGRRVQICGRLEPRLEIRTAAQVFFIHLPPFFLFLPPLLVVFLFYPPLPFLFLFYPPSQFFFPFLPPLPILLCFYIPKVGCILRGKSGIRHQVWQFSAQNCSWFSDLVHQIAREKQYPGKKIQNISFSHFRDELSVARCLCWFSIVKPLCFSQPSVSTGTHFHSWQLI